jgi:hypothetical protein
MILRHLLVTAVGDKLILEGKHIFSPITESHMYQQYGDAGHKWDFWEKHDKLMLRKCDELWVLTLPGWEESVGVQAEIQYANQRKMPIKYIRVFDVLPELKEIILGDINALDTRE